MHPHASGDRKLFKAINRSYQIFANDAAREAYKILALEEAEKYMSCKN